MNRMTLKGRLGQDGVLRHTQQGTAVLELSVADNKKKGETFIVQWFKVVLWSYQAEKYAPFCKKGAEVWAEGEYEKREYTDKGGAKKYSEQLNANTFGVFLASSGQKNESEEPSI